MLQVLLQRHYCAWRGVLLQGDAAAAGGRLLQLLCLSRAIHGCSRLQARRPAQMAAALL